MRIFGLVFLLQILFTIGSFAQTTGTGCNLGNRVYTQYLGMDNVYGGAAQRVYANPGAYYDINFNGYSATKPNNENYVCGQINSYTSPVSRQDLSTSNTDCVTEATLHGAPNGNGKLATYKVNDPAKCSTTSVPVGNNYTFILFMILVTGIAGLSIRNRKQLGNRPSEKSSNRVD